MALRVLEPIRTPRGFVLYPFHYTHSPKKASDEWCFNARKDYASQTDWNREMEIDFSSQAGNRTYASFDRRVHVAEEEIQVNPLLPLHLEVDFNVDPCVWEVSQTRVAEDSVTGVRHNVDAYVDEIVLAPASIEAMVNEFRNRFPAHKAEVWIYGDATGHGRSAQTARSSYDLMRLAFTDYPCNILWRVAKNNPAVRDRVNAVNRRLIGADGKPGILISPTCKELILDFEEVVWREDGKDILKVYSAADPYHRRTHSSDCVGYRVARDYPVIAEAVKVQTEKRLPLPTLKYGRVLGQIEGGRR